MRGDAEATPSPKDRRHTARRHQIMEAALAIAQQDDWQAVTTRRLAEAIDYSQPVLYQHFTNRDDLLRAIAEDGFITLANAIRPAADADSGPLESACRAYLSFAESQPRLYEVMFSLPTTLQFDSPNTPAALRDTFDHLASLIAQEHDGDPEAAAEFFWAACHGLASLIAAGRIPRDRLAAHISRVVRSAATL